MTVKSKHQSTSGKAEFFLKADFLELFLLVLFAFMPFSFYLSETIFSSLSVFGMSLFNAVTVAVLILCSLSIVFRTKKIPEYSPLPACFLLVFVIVLKIIFQGCIDEFMSWIRQYQYYFFVPLMLFVVLNLKMSSIRFIDTMLIVSIPVCLISLYSFATSDYFGLVSYEVIEAYAIVGTPYCRMMGTFGSPNVAGSYFAIMLIAVVFLGRSSSFNKKNESRFIRLLQFALLSICLILTFSRMALIGFAVSVFLFFINGDSGKKGALISGVLRGFIFAVLIVLLIMWLASSGIYFWMPGDFINNPRLDKWTDFLGNFESWLILGSPFGSHIASGSSTLSDNVFLLLAGGIGLVPTILYFILLAKPIMSRCRMWSKLMIFMLMLLIFMMLSDFVSLYPSNYIAIPLINYLALIEGGFNEDPDNHPPMSLSSQ